MKTDIFSIAFHTTLALIWCVIALTGDTEMAVIASVLITGNVIAVVYVAKCLKLKQ